MRDETPLGTFAEAVFSRHCSVLVVCAYYKFKQ